jgi:hypothetical protein
LNDDFVVPGAHSALDDEDFLAVMLLQERQAACPSHARYSAICRLASSISVFIVGGIQAAATRGFDSKVLANSFGKSGEALLTGLVICGK